MTTSQEEENCPQLVLSRSSQTHSCNPIDPQKGSSSGNSFPSLVDKREIADPTKIRHHHKRRARRYCRQWPWKELPSRPRIGGSALAVSGLCPVPRSCWIVPRRPRTSWLASMRGGIRCWLASRQWALASLRQGLVLHLRINFSLHALIKVC